MSTTNFSIPVLDQKGIIVDYRDKYIGGYGWRGDRPLSEIKYVVIHHSVSSLLHNADSEIAAIAKEHITNRQWGGIGYNIVITSEELDGYAKVAYVGDMGTIRAHTPNEKGSFGLTARHGNYYLLGICIVGSLVDDNPTPAQLKSLHLVCKNLIYDDNRYTNLETWDNLKNHKDFDYTSCAGNFDNYKNLIINPPNMDATFAASLADAKKWKDTVKTKYGVDIMSKVDGTVPTREQLLVILHRFTQYLQKSPVV